jgi:ribonuclease-3
MSQYPAPIQSLEATIGYTFNDKNIIKKALTHSSYANEQKVHTKKIKTDCNERLEFLGDSVLSLIVSEYLYQKYSENPEGYLTKLRASVVCSKSLSSLADEIRLGEYLFLGKGEEETGRSNQKILENAFEALLAAIYIDSGNSKDTVSKFLLPIIIPKIEEISKREITDDYKTALQQFVQSNGNDKLQYVCVRESGPDHAKIFDVELRLNSNVVGTGSGRTKREAEQFAAKEACLLFDVKWDI